MKKLLMGVTMIFMCVFMFSEAAHAVPPDLPGDATSLDLKKVFNAPIRGTGVTETWQGPELVNNNRVLIINPDANDLFGAIWSKYPVNMAKDFHFVTYLYLGSAGTSAADGITFTLTNDERMNSDYNAVIGEKGVGLGAYGDSLGNYVHNALSIEFDTFRNSGSMDYGIGRGNNGHSAFVIPKYNSGKLRGEHISPVTANYPLSNGGWGTLAVDWDAKTRSLSYSFNTGRVRELLGTYTFSSDSAMDSTFNFSKNKLVYWGFTASTGGKKEENAIAVTRLPGDIEFSANLENITSGSGEQLKVDANKADHIRYNLGVTYDNAALIGVEEDHLILELPKGISYENTPIKIGDSEVPKENITYTDNNGKHIIEISHLPINTPDLLYPVTIDAVVDQNAPNQTYVANFKMINGAHTETVKSDDLSVEVKTLGRVKIAYQLEDGTEILDPVIKTEEIGTDYAFQPKDIPSYKYVKTSGNTTGKYSETMNTIIFYYKPNQFTINQTVDHSSIIPNGTLAYDITVTSKMVKDPNVKYKNFVICSKPLDSHLSISDSSKISLVNSKKQPVGKVSYDPVNRQVIGTITSDDALESTEGFTLHYETVVAGDTPVGTVLLANAEAYGEYTQIPSTAQPQNANEVSTKVIPAIVPINVYFKDDQGSNLIDKEFLTVDGKVGDTINLSTQDNIKNQIDLLVQKGYILDKEQSSIYTVKPSDNEFTYIFHGALQLLEAPKLIDFGLINLIDYNKQINIGTQPTGNQLIVRDTRSNPTPWKITAEVTKPLTNLNNAADTLDGALYFKYKNQDVDISNQAGTIYQSDANVQKGQYEITKYWKNDHSSDGLKYHFNDRVPKAVQYEGEITWRVSNTEI